MSWIEHIININLVFDKIIVSTWVQWDTYTTAVGTTAPPPLHRYWYRRSAAVGTTAPPLLALPLCRRIHLTAWLWL